MNILRELRTKKGVYQKDVAKYLGVDRTTYVKYERGDSEPSIDIIKKLANYFDVTVDFLVGKEKKANTLDEQLSGIEFALYGEIHDLTDDEKQDILSYVKFKKSQRQE
jgi:transcriptional regulator with XRE-family HTH domain|nr:MAG TPA_asm: Repressor protein CI [Caudoviricetes sp.]